MSGPQISQVALCTADPPLTALVFSEGLGFADAGVRYLHGKRLATIQALGDDARTTLGWLVGRQDLVQLELFCHTLPPQRPLPADWRPSDLGWVRFGVAVPNLDRALERLGALGVSPLTAPAVRDGLRRVCIREPGCGVIVELFEEGSATPGGIRPRFYELEPAVVYLAVSVPELGEAKRFFGDALGLVERQDVVLHEAADEALWGLAGAKADRIVLQGGDVFLELVRYEDPVGRPKPEGHVMSDQGFMNGAVGFRDSVVLKMTFDRLVAAGYVPNIGAPSGAGGTYVNDAQGNTAELLVCPRELDDSFGFSPRTPLYRPPSWQRAELPPAS